MIYLLLLYYDILHIWGLGNKTTKTCWPIDYFWYGKSTYLFEFIGFKKQLFLVIILTREIIIFEDFPLGVPNWGISVDTWGTLVIEGLVKGIEEGV